MAEEEAKYALGDRVRIHQEAWDGKVGRIIQIRHRDEYCDYLVAVNDPYDRTVLFLENELSLAGPEFEFAKLDCVNYGAIDVSKWMDRHDEMPEEIGRILQDASNDYLLSLKALQDRIRKQYEPLMEQIIPNPDGATGSVYINYPAEVDDLWYS